MKHTYAIFSAMVALAVAPASAQIANFTPTLDGTVDGGYGAAIAVQTTQTQFGNVTSGFLGGGGGEFDALYAAQDGTNLYLMIAGNQEANGNNCYVFIDNVGEAGGDSGTLGDIPGGDTFANAGLFSNAAIGGASLPAGFNVDLGIQFKHFNNGSVGTGDSLEWRSTAVDYTTDSLVLDTTNPTDLSTGADANTDTSFSASDSGVTYALDNSNVDGIDGGLGAAIAASAEAVTTGIELAIPFTLIPGTVDAASTIKVLVFYSSGDGTFASNQFLPGLPTPADNVGGNEDWVALGLSVANLPFQAAVLPFSTTFDDATSANDFDVLDTFLNSSVATIQADPNTNIVFGADYSAFLGAGVAVPEAPSTPGGAAATRGVIIQGNLTDTSSGVMMFWNQNLSVDYRATFDYFDAYDGGGGSTESLWIGTNTTGTRYNGETDDTNPGKDGYLFMFHGDYDVAGSDARFGEGNTAGTGPDDNYIPNKDSGSTLDLPNDGVLTGVRWGDGLFPDDNARDIGDVSQGGDADSDFLIDLFTNAMPNSVDSGGTARPGGTINTWSTVQVQYVGGQLTITINGVQFITYNDADDTFTSGLFMMGHEDVFTSVSANHTGVFDNFSVEEVLTTAVGDYSLYR